MPGGAHPLADEAGGGAVRPTPQAIVSPLNAPLRASTTATRNGRRTRVRSMSAECERAALRSGVLSASELRPFCWRIWLSSDEHLLLAARLVRDRPGLGDAGHDAGRPGRRRSLEASTACPRRSALDRGTAIPRNSGSGMANPSIRRTLRTSGLSERHAALDRLRAMSAPGHTALGAWSGGRYMHFGEELDDERFVRLLRPDEAHPHRRDGRCLRRRRGRSRRRPRARGPAARVVLARRRGRPRLLRHAARRREGLPALHAPSAPPGEYAGYLRDATERSLERCGVDALRRAPAAQPRSRRLHVARRLGGDGRPARGRALQRHRRRARAGQRLHARRHRLPGALRRPDRLGDADPQPARALAGPAGAARPASATACACWRAWSTTAGCSTTTCPTRARSARPTTAGTARRAGSTRGARGSTSCGRSPIATA